MKIRGVNQLSRSRTCYTPKTMEYRFKYLHFYGNRELLEYVRRARTRTTLNSIVGKVARKQSENVRKIKRRICSIEIEFTYGLCQMVTALID